MSFSSSKSNPQRIYDVFLNFRGEDTRRNFVSHVYASLSNAGIYTFLDDEKLDKGQMLLSEISRAIEGSKISIVVFSVTYCQSSWCLCELEKIMECHRTIGQVVLPIFYDLDPSHVRHQKGAFGEALDGLAVTFSGLGMTDKVSGWKRALTDAANLAGWDVRSCRSDSKVVNDIVGAVLEKLDITSLSITDFPVGLESRVHDVIHFLDKKSRRVHIVGIWGMGGIGKTTIAKAIYNKIHHNFGYKSFLANIREVWEKDRGQTDLQEQLLSDILKTRKMKIHSIERGKGMIKERLCSKRALVVLDDVTEFEQLNALCGKRNGIGPGSVIIITTRDVRLLNVLEVDYVYGVDEMNERESLELFSWHAFREESPREDFIELSRKVVAYCGGLPLALEILGSHLYERTKLEWISVLSKLDKVPDDQVQKKLRISFDGLRDHMEKDIFLDICCFFIGKDRAYVTQILNGCGLHADIGITVLIERSLIKVENSNKLGMHSLLRDMGREIVRQSSPKEHEKRSRLWFHKDVLDVLTKNTGTEATEGLAMKLQRTSGVCFNANAFLEMKRLRLLQLDHLLEWLKILNLSHSRYLTNTPDFSNLPNLEKLILKDCPSLTKVHQSIGYLNNILMINLKDCTCLSNLPRIIYKLKSLKILILSGCSKIDKLEEDIVQMESLTTLTAENTAVKQVPFSIVRSKSIGYICLCGCEGLTRDVFPSLIWSWMSPTMNPVSHIHPFGSMSSSSLVSLEVHNNNLGDLSPMLSVQCCSEFQLTQYVGRILDDIYDVNFTTLETTSHASQISEYSLRSLLIGMGSYHQVFNTLSQSISKGLITSESGNILLPDDNYPYWLTRTGEGQSVLFKVPPVSDCSMKGMILCVVYSSIPESMAAECLIGFLIINYTKCTIQLYKRDTIMTFNDEEWQGIVSNLGPDDKVEILVAFGHGLTVKKTAVYLINGESIDKKMEPSPEPEENDFIRTRKKMRM